ncbi:glycosyltransferase family 4 protein [Sphingomonas sp.]|uniref:glycosyltransferase family 4 protein n=1 Tax=Sphingomonas sp. TaxID=28214 RepID=UPI0018415A7F|nr:glycosyltransferase family 4 protein [Sphingomonas sp.]MBA3511189.1 glycosyltransferase family 4 protein [Sphingomonas sp.]
MSANEKQAPRAGLVVLLNSSYGQSLIKFRARLIEELVAAGHEVHVTAPDFDEALVSKLAGMGATAHQVPLARTGIGPLSDLRYALSIRKLIRRIGAELVVSYTSKPNIWASLAAGSVGVRSASLITGLGYAFTEGGGLKRRLISLVSRLLYRLATSRNDVVIFQNPDDRADFLATGCLTDPSKARLVNGSGVDIEQFAVAPLPDAPVFLMVSRLLGTKGVREYAQAGLALRSRRPDCRFLLAGYHDEGPDGVGVDEVNGWQAAGLEYLGHLADVRPAIAQASIFVLPSYYREGTPRSTLEAMAMGRPVITTDMPGCRETVVDAENGFLVPPREANALEEAMQRLASDPSMRARMGTQSRRLCERRFEVGQVTQTLLEHLSANAS